MAKSSWKERNKKKQRIVAKYAELRAELRSKRDYAGLAQLPRNASPTRVVNRCKITGRGTATFANLGYLGSLSGKWLSTD